MRARLKSLSVFLFFAHQLMCQHSTYGQSNDSGIQLNNELNGTQIIGGIDSPSDSISDGSVKRAESFNVEGDITASDLLERVNALEKQLSELKKQQSSGESTKDETSATAVQAESKQSDSDSEQASKAKEGADKSGTKAKDDEKASKAKSGTDKDADKKSEWTDLSNDKWNVKLGGHMQLDYVNWAHADPAIAGAQNYFNYRRLRLVADGTGYGVFDFRLQMTLEPGQGPTNEFATPDVKDAYLSMNEIPGVGRFRIGNFFVPFSLEQVTNDTNNIFMERSVPSQGVFAADREVGMAFYNCTLDQSVTWSGGMFFDDLSDTFKARVDDNQGYRLSGRLTWLPYYDEPSNGRYLIHTGVGILHTDDFDDRVRFRTRPQVQRGPILIDTGNLIADSYTSSNAELAIVWGRVTLQNEAFLSQVNGVAENYHVGGAYSHLSYFLTGENRVFERFGQHGAQFARNKPFTNFFATPGGIGWGAWEAKARWSYLDLSDADAGQYNDLTAGFNWYWSDRTRIMFDWIHPLTTQDTVFGSTESDLLAMRFDVNW